MICCDAIYFNPRTPCGVRLSLSPTRNRHRNFNPRTPCGARPCPSTRSSAVLLNFNPRAPCGARLKKSSISTSLMDFNPRAPCGARPTCSLYMISTSLFQSTRPLRGATPHSPASRSVSCRFQSTRPLRGATDCEVRVRRAASNFNPRAPCGARPQRADAVCKVAGISIHAPLAGRDLRGTTAQSSLHQFQSTRPLRGATSGRTVLFPTILFQSTRPLRGATSRKHWLDCHRSFQSTRPLRGATKCRTHFVILPKISIHAPLAGRDSTGARS